MNSRDRVDNNISFMFNASYGVRGVSRKKLSAFDSCLVFLLLQISILIANVLQFVRKNCFDLCYYLILKRDSSL